MCRATCRHCLAAVWVLVESQGPTKVRVKCWTFTRFRYQIILIGVQASLGFVFKSHVGKTTKPESFDVRSHFSNLVLSNSWNPKFHGLSWLFLLRQFEKLPFIGTSKRPRQDLNETELQETFPMYTMPVHVLLQMTKMLPHEELLAAGSWVSAEFQGKMMDH